MIDAQLEELVRAIISPCYRCTVSRVAAAAPLVAAGVNPERLASRAAFAALSGVAPIRASSGQRIRHRLSRGGNRLANNALHRIVPELETTRHRRPRPSQDLTRRCQERGSLTGVSVGRVH